MECQIDKPPSEAMLLNANQRYPEIKDAWEARFLIMYDAYLSQTSNLEQCDLSKKSIRSWNKQHLELKHETRAITQ